METVSAQWAPALTGNHGLAVQVDAIYDGATVLEDIPFVDGSVKVDRGSDVRRTLSLTIADPAHFPVDPTDTFGVYGQRLWVRRGIEYLNGSREMVPLGMFVITSVSGNIHTGPLSVSAAGLESLVKAVEFETAVSTTGWASTAAGISALITDAIPGVGFTNLSTNGAAAIATRTWDAGTNAWAAVTEMAAAIGAECYCDASGSFILADVPDAASSDSYVWDVTTGDAGVLVSADVALTSADVYNRVIALGENTSDNTAPVSATATVTEVSDPVRYGGPMGKRTKRYSSPLITSAAKALAAASAMLRRYRAPNRSVTLQTVPNPALDVGDRIRVDYGPGIDPELHLVQALTIPLSTSGGASTIDTVSGRATA
ncbi:DUF5047 domain-containing protein [Streptomyces sp. NPDC006540]|uniref:DUF5047 domain-containing protein n=1 Tax=Streptomyces sp. NPDC006540 TaxID=3155353 RepID=UPI0033ACA99A